MSANFQELLTTIGEPSISGRKKGGRPRIHKQHLYDKLESETTTKRNKVKQRSEVKRNVRNYHDESADEVERRKE